jgi:hypothetical protein
MQMSNDLVVFGKIGIQSQIEAPWRDTSNFLCDLGGLSVD